MNHREITKKYSEILTKIEFANGRKEVVKEEIEPKKKGWFK